MATECCVALVAAALAVAVLGLTPLALALLAVCALTMAPPLVVLGRLERRSSND